ncbi:MAG: cation-translocating P-type ATPase, partial [Candidatus Ranarchaeia archaeon]
MNYFNQSPEEIVEQLKTNSESGLSTKEALERLLKFGPNEIPQAKKSIWHLYFAPLFNWLIILYLISSSVLFFLGDTTTSIVTLAVVVLNGITAIIQQFRAQRALEALQKLAADTATVIRDGKKIEVERGNLVKGDLIQLNAGDLIPADSYIMNSVSMIVNEAGLTGESEPVAKMTVGEAIQDGEVPLGDRKNMLFLGTSIATGHGRAIVVQTGPDTQLGRIAGELAGSTTQDIPLRTKINTFAKYLAIGVVILLSISLVYQTWIRLDILTLDVFLGVLKDSIGYGMNLMPINIPLLTTIILLTGVIAMAKQGVIIRNLGGVESLGRISVLCTDKTGTLTKNQMTVKYIWADDKFYKISGNGYDPDGDIYLWDKDGAQMIGTSPVDIQTNGSLKQLITAGYLNNNAEIVSEEVKPKKRGQTPSLVWKISGAPTEAALKVVYEKAKLKSPQDELSELTFLKEFPFDSRVKRMSKVFKQEDKTITYVKGASEVILPKSSYILKNGKRTRLEESQKQEVLELLNSFANKGFRVLSIAQREIDPKLLKDDQDRDTVENQLTYLGFACIQDPPRNGVLQAVKETETAGIDVIMITGDSKNTAGAIARELSILEKNEAVREGSEVDDLKNNDFKKTAVFARVSPEHKQTIVTRYQKDYKRVVAMTGDGVNDALALNIADVGMAMGITGTDVAKEASDLVISDDSFVSIVTGIKEGRGLFSKIRAVVYFYLVVNLMEATVIFGSSFIPFFQLFTYWQLTMLYFTAHSLPPLALVVDRINPKAMEDKPRDSEDIIDKKLLRLMIVHALSMVISLVAIYSFALTIYPVFPENLFGIIAAEVTDRQQKARTMAMAVIIIVEAFAVLSIRRPNQSLI